MAIGYWRLVADEGSVRCKVRQDAQVKRNAPVWAPLWRAHMRAEFPGRLRGEEVAGVDFVMLDADIAGCVVSWGTGDAAQQAARESSLRLLVRDAELVLETLTAPDEVEYFDRLHRLASLVLERVPPARSTEWYVLVDDAGADADHEDRQRMSLACQVLLELLRPQVQSLQVDAYSDLDDVMPADVRDVECWIAAKGEARRRSNLGRMGVQLDPTDDDEWHKLRDYAAWSINVDLFDDRPLATFHDSGQSVTARLTTAQAVTANEQLPTPWKVRPLAPILLAQKQKRRLARRDHRAADAARWHLWWRSKFLCRSSPG